ncbi:MAG: GDYXXLXY domain-containing protein [bacterium]|nr:GDYXXLXY domain-containing protein [bacterium]
MKCVVLAIVALLQVAVLAYMAGEREWILQNGQTVHLRTAPVNPRDPMRGDYVALDYDIAHVPLALCTGDIALALVRSNVIARGTSVYAVLTTNDSVAHLVTLTDQRPADGSYIRGRIDNSWRPGVTARYGIEAYFMQQGKALALERGRVREGIQVPLEMAVALSPRGVAVIKDHRWAQLGIGLDLVFDPAHTNRHIDERVVAATVRLMNAGTTDVALVDLPGGRSFSLVPVFNRWGRDHYWRWAGENDPAPLPQPANVVLLKPGQILTNRIEYSDPHWFVIEDTTNKVDAVAKPLCHAYRDWSAMFRMEYRAPEPAACTALPHRAVIWHGSLATRSFSGSGRVD